MESKKENKQIVGLWSLEGDGLEALEIAWALKQKELGRKLTGNEMHELMQKLADKNEVKKILETVGDPKEIKKALRENFNVKEIPQGGKQDG